MGPSRPAASITADDLTPPIKVLYDRKKLHFAEFVRTCLRAAFQHALKSKHDVSSTACGIDWGLKVNPVDYIKRIETKRARDGALSPAEYRHLYHWLDHLSARRRYRIYAHAVMLMMATGQRPSEILCLTPSHYDQSEVSLAWATTKNGRPHQIPIGRQARSLIERMEPNAAGLYFPRQKKWDEPMIVDSAATIVEKYIRETGAEHFQLRDLRRSWKSLAADANISKEACDRLQNHAFRDVASLHYDRSDHWVMKCDAVDRWSDVMAFMLYSEEPVTRRALGRLSPRPTLLLDATIMPSGDDNNPGPSTLPG